MIPLYTKEQFDSAKSLDKLPLQCEFCGKTFYTQKRIIKDKRGVKKFCSFSCLGKSTLQKTLINCKQCNKEFLIKKSQLKKGKNHFCSISCNVKYTNSHKTCGSNRSKLEIYLEEQLTKLYPELKILYNDKNKIGSELDIYIPSLEIAFELNGIFHYEPIFGESKLNQTQKNDQNKFKLCQEHKISLCIIDTSSQKYFKENSSKKYLDIITNIISKND
jgi:hypothetical protein